ncbi:MAG: glycerate kinase [Spirochaetales bacterium]|nr:glycerate kinase [Spirochaetales bacterium]
MDEELHRKHLTEIFTAGVERVDPCRMIRSLVALKGDLLTVALPEQPVSFDLSAYRRVLVLGAGKATARMARALEAVLGDRIDGGLISVKYDHTENLRRIETIEAGHPLPDENSVRAGEALAALAAEADRGTLVINLISGGGSALLSLPWSEGTHHLTLEEKQETTRQLLGCGATIQEINCVRKHLSGIKGGRLAELIHPATCLNLILSDVVGDRLDSIASGLTVADETTFQDAKRIMEKYRIWDTAPTTVREIISFGAAGKIRETPKAGEDVFRGMTNMLIGTNRSALLAAAEKAENLGYNTLILSSRIIGEAREIAQFYHALAAEIAAFDSPVKKPACLIGGGETTVTLKGSGKGGRNQEMALSFLNSLSTRSPGAEGCFFLSAGTDGTDGPTDAAGAFADQELAEKWITLGLDLQASLDNNDAYNFFKPLGGLLITGPTNTNVCDLQVLLVI